MTTATISPLEAYQQGRDQFLAEVLGVMSGLESSVLGFEGLHEKRLRAAGLELSSARNEVSRLERQAVDQAAELDSVRGHRCPAAAPVDVFGTETAAPEVHDVSAADLTSLPDVTPAADYQRTITDLQSQITAEQRTVQTLREELAESRETSTGLQDSLRQQAASLASAAEAHRTYVRENEESLVQRLQDGAQAIEAAVRDKAGRVLGAIAADNPNLAEAAELFNVAFPAEADDEPVRTAPAARPAPALTPEPEPRDDFFADADQVLMASPELGDDAILDPHFFDTPPTLDEPDTDEEPAAAADQGSIERKKEDQRT